MGMFGKSMDYTDKGILDALIEGYDLKKAMEATSFHGFRSQAVERMACGVKVFRKITGKKNPEEVPARKYAMKEYLLESAVGSVVFAYQLAVKEGNEEVIEDVKKCLFSPYVLKCCEQWHKQSQHHLVLQYFCLVNAIGVPSAGYPQNAEKASMLLQKVKTVVDKEFDEYDLSVFINEVNRATGDNKEKCSLNTDEMSTPAKTETKRTEFNNGDVYEGEYVDGKKHGHGKYTSAKGWVYEGDFADDTMTGYAKIVFANGGYYEGGFLNGKRNGTGKEKLTDGTIYEGEYQNDKKQGMGKYTFTSGAEYVGITIDGKKEGHGKYTLADGTYFDGEWKDNKRQGHFVYTEKLGEFLQQYEGEFVDDKPDGRHVGFTVGSASGNKDLHFYENGESVGCVTLTEETKNWTVSDFRESRKRSNAEIGLDEHGYPLPVSSSASTASVVPVSDDADSENEWESFEDIKDLLFKLRMPSLFVDPRDRYIGNSCEYMKPFIEEAREEFNGGDNAAVNEIIGSIFNITPEDLCNATYEWEKKISYPSFESYLNSALYSLSFFESEDPDYVLIPLANVVYYMWKQDSDNNWFSILCHVWAELGGECDENLLWFKRMRDCGDCNGTADDPIDENNFSEILDRHNYDMGSDCKLYEQAPTAKDNSLYRYEPPEVDDKYKLDKVLAAVFNVGEYVEEGTLTQTVYENWLGDCPAWSINMKTHSRTKAKNGSFSDRKRALKPLQDYIFNASRATQRLRESIPADDYNEFKKSLDDYIYLAKDALESDLVDAAFDWYLQAYNHGYDLRRLGEICEEIAAPLLRNDEESRSFDNPYFQIMQIAAICNPNMNNVGICEIIMDDYSCAFGFLEELLLDEECNELK